MVYNGILMETIRISVMVSIGLLVLFSRVDHTMKVNYLSWKWVNDSFVIVGKLSLYTWFPAELLNEHR